ncbi:class I SAM-dependent methyltransferase [Streptomyces sp. NPDC005373]|uniref:class I SAM-dependent methyltransferase n=1 Tax=Streptomyces sp. NPDC005373 TaxID=3156879 RepID=UPI0033A59E07
MTRGRYLRMLAEVPAFHRAARRLQAESGDDALTLDEFLIRGRFSAYFVAHFVTPLVAAVWSCDAATARRAPARYLFRFLAHRGLLSVTGSPVWRTVTGGSRSYVDRVVKQLGAVHTATPVRSVRRHADGVELTAEDGLTTAYDSVVNSGTSLLEIGTGWGELAIRAVRRGARVTTLTLSAEQRDLARERTRTAGAADRVSVELCDYREARGTYDAVVSVEMVEAVGVEFWPVYFRTLDERLAPDGRAALQAITMPHDRMLASRGTFTWIHKYIFPGGQLPSVEAIEETVRDRAGLCTARRDGFGAHYAETLRLWRERFTERADEVEGLGFDDTFRRMWTFYLAYSEAGFRAGYLDVQQYLFTKDGPRGGSATVPRPGGGGR